MSKSAVPPHVPPELVVDFDFYEPPGGRVDIHAAWKKLQSDSRSDIVWSPYNGGHWIFLRAEDIHRGLADFAHFSSRRLLIPREPGEEYRGLPNTIDPPESLKFRALLTADFAPRNIRALETAIRNEAVSLIESFSHRGHCEFIEDYAAKLPVSVFMMLCDLPMSDAPMLKYLADQLPRPDGTMTLAEVAQKLADYLVPYLERRRASPGSDLLSRLANGIVDGRPITFEESLDLCRNTLFGGLDTVAVTHGFAMHFLSTHPDQRRQLAADRSLIPSVVDELFRRFAIACPGRVVQQDVEVAGVKLKKDDMVLFPTMLHGLDERVYPDPMRVDFHREVGATSTFGNGHHQCPGRFLARTEISITLEEWFRRIPEFELDPAAEIKMIPGIVVALQNLPLRWPGAGRSH